MPTSYSWDAKDYRAHSSAQLQWAIELIGKIHLRGDERVLDIGSGDGKVTATIARLVPRGSVLGIDASHSMVELAVKEQPPSQYPNLEFRVQDVLATRFDNDFEVVFSNATLHWITNHEGLLRKISQALKPGGKLIAQMGGRGNAASIIDVFDGLIAGATWSTYFQDFTFPYSFHCTDEYTTWLVNAGLKPIRVELIPKDMVQAGKAGLSSWIRTTWFPYIDRVPEQLRGQFINSLVDGYVARHPLDADGKVHVQMVRLEVEAFKE